MSKIRSFVHLSFALMLVLSCVLHSQEALDNALNTPDELYGYATGLYGRKFYDMALAEFNKFLTLYQDDQRFADALVLKSNCLDKLNKTDELVTLTREFCRLYPNSKHVPAMWQRAANILFGKKNYEEAAEIYRILTKSEDIAQQENATYFLYKCELANGRRKDALGLCKSLADKQFEKNFKLRVYAANDYASALYNSGNHKQALEYYNRILAAPELPDQLCELAMYHVATIYYKMNDLPKAEEAITRFLAKYPNSPNARNIGKCLVSISARNPDNAKRTIELAQEWRKKYPDAVDWDIDSILANVLLQCKLYNEAIPFYSRLQDDPAVPQEDRRIAAFNVAYCLCMAGHYSEAEKKAEAYVNENPRSTNTGDALMIWAQSLIKQEKYAQSVVPLKKAMAFFAGDLPNYENAGVTLIDTYVKTENVSEAAMLLLEMAPKFPSPRKWELMLNAADFQMRANELDKARETFSKVAANNDDQKLADCALEMLLQIYLQKEDYKDALDSLAKLAEHRPEGDRGDLDYSTAVIYYRMSDYENAEKTLLRSLESKNLTEAKVTRANILLATIYLTEKQYKKAIPVLEHIFSYKFDDIKAQLTPAFMFLNSDAYLDANDTIKAENALRLILTMDNATIADKINAKFRIAKSLLRTPSRAKEAEELLQEIMQAIEKHQVSGLDLREVQSFMAEAQLVQKRYTAALLSAEKALEGASKPSVQARALYVMAYVRLNEEKRPDAANKLATQCFILFNDPEYSPKAMGLSIQSFVAMKQPERANEVLRELSSKYPDWLAAHPEISALLQ